MIPIKLNDDLLIVYRYGRRGKREEGERENRNCWPLYLLGPLVHHDVGGDL